MIRRLAAALLFSCAALVPLHAHAETRRFAVVVGANEPKRGLDPLRYADDDALKTYELLTAAGVETILVTTPDPDTQNVYQASAYSRAVLAKARPARRIELERAISETLEAVSKVKQSGRGAELLFWFGGHGGADGAEFAMFLEQGDAFSQSDLKRMLESSSADFNHVIVDACHARSLVTGRGEDPIVEAHLTELADDTITTGIRSWANQGNTGWIVAFGGKDAKTYEWDEYRGGVVSHAVRSALTGAADLSGDAAVSYPEVDGFVYSASVGVPAPARPRVAVVAPANAMRHPLVDWTAARAPRLELGPRLAGRVVVSDAAGNRLVELNKGVKQVMRLALLPRPRYYATLDGQELDGFDLAEGSSVEFDTLRRSSHGPTTEARGGRMDEAFRAGLFVNPFTREIYRVLCEQKGSCEVLPAEPPDAPPRPAEPVLTPRARPPVPPQSTERRRTFGSMPYVLLGTAAVAGGSAAVFFQFSENAYARYKAAPPEGKHRQRDITRDWDWATTIALGVAGTAGAAGVGLLVWEQLSPTVSVAPGSASATISGKF
jgi:hypothetical protein